MYSGAPEITPTHLTLQTLPSELRQLIYTQLFRNLSLLITPDGDLDLTHYPYQIASVCHDLRTETLSSLVNTTPTSRLTLICPEGRFPPSLRSRLPTRILHSIRYITVLNNIYHDDLRPSLRTFPNLATLTFDLTSSDHRGFLGVVHAPGTMTPPRMSDEMSKLARRTIFWLHYEQTMPGEGLERDYIPETTLWEVVNTDRRKRGFDIKAWVRCGGFPDEIETGNGERELKSRRKEVHEKMVVMLDLETSYGQFT